LISKVLPSFEKSKEVKKEREKRDGRREKG